MKKKQIDEKEVIELALDAGHILLENGAEISRVEETIARISRHYGVNSESEFVLSNGIFITAGDDKDSFFAKVQHIPVSGTHLDKVVAVNHLSREIVQGKYTVKEARRELERIKKETGKKKTALILASGIGSSAFCYLFGGSLEDTLAAFFVGVVLYCYLLFFCAKHLRKLMTNITGGIFLTILCGFLHWIGLGKHPEFMIIGSIMPLIPGYAFTNAIREIADGDYISGSVRMLDALLIFICIAIGVGLGVAFVKTMMGGALL
ncbi:MAG: threonine/serine exporter family protein [Schaedlerella sp.]|nr:threonine/serine exporter family protein [Schaedlerella sp.]